MPQVYIPKDLYDRIAAAGTDPTAFVQDAVRKELDRKTKGARP